MQIDFRMRQRHDGILPMRVFVPNQDEPFHKWQKPLKIDTVHISRGHSIPVQMRDIAAQDAFRFKPSVSRQCISLDYIKWIIDYRLTRQFI